jgi:hypothetical protein
MSNVFVLSIYNYKMETSVTGIFLPVTSLTAICPFQFHFHVESAIFAAMPRKTKTTEERKGERSARAKANGYVKGAHRTTDSTRFENKLTGDSIILQDRALNAYKEYIAARFSLFTLTTLTDTPL